MHLKILYAMFKMQVVTSLQAGTGLLLGLQAWSFPLKQAWKMSCPGARLASPLPLVYPAGVMYEAGLT